MATTTNYGWETPDDTDLVKDGALAIRTLGNNIDTTESGRNLAGLVLIKTQTIGTTVSSVTVTSAFSTTYDDYKIIVSGGVGSASAFLAMSLVGAGNDYYFAFSATTYAGVASNSGGVNAANWSQPGYCTSAGITLNADISMPFLTKPTTIRAPYVAIATTTSAGMFAGYRNNTTSYTDFTIAPSSGTLTGGTIYVYGYRKAI